MRDPLGSCKGGHVCSYTVLAMRPAWAAVAWFGNGALVSLVLLRLLEPSRTFYLELVCRTFSRGTTRLPRSCAAPARGLALLELCAMPRLGWAIVQRPVAAACGPRSSVGAAPRCRLTTPPMQSTRTAVAGCGIDLWWPHLPLAWSPLLFGSLFTGMLSAGLHRFPGRKLHCNYVEISSVLSYRTLLCC